MMITAARELVLRSPMRRGVRTHLLLRTSARHGLVSEAIADSSQRFERLDRERFENRRILPGRVHITCNLESKQLTSKTQAPILNTF
jgi:hypothetical protein